MSVRMRLMLVTDAVGGVWTYSVQLAAALREQGVETVLAVMGPSATATQLRDAGGFELVDTGLPLDWTAERPDQVRRGGCALAELATAQSVDIVQTNSAALLADCDFDQPVVVVQHSCVPTWWRAVRGTPLPPDFAWRRDLIDCGLNAASAVVAPTAAFAAQVMRVYGLARPVQAIYNGRRALPMRKRGPEDFVLTVGRLWDDGKNVRVLDNAAARLNAPVEAVGPLSGPNGTAVSFEHLQTPGELPLEQISTRFAARPIFASSALYEPFGLSVLEAAQAGCALVLSDIPTLRELWGGAAIFVAADDAEGFASAIDSMIAQPERRAELGAEAQIRALRYTPEAMAGRMAQLYAGLLPEACPSDTAGAFQQFAGAR
jgi:glycosyltransferase involved in cell wall biosynthesis